MDKYLTTEDIAQRLGVRVETVRRWLRTGRLVGFPIGRAGYRIRQDDFERFVGSQRQHVVASSAHTVFDGKNGGGVAAMEATATMILERISDGVLLLGFDERCLYANEAVGRLLDRKVGDLLGKGLMEIVGTSVMRTGASTISDGDDYFSPATGRWYQVRLFATPQGRCLSFYDITERKQAEEALREERAIIKSFYDSVPFMMGVAELDGDHTVAISANQKMADFFKRAKDDFRGRSGSELGTPEEVERLWVEQYRRCERERSVVNFAYHEPRLGDSAWLNVTLAFIAEGSTGLPRFSFVVENVTEQQHIQQALRESEELFRTLSNAAPALIWYNDAEGRNVFINQFFVDFTGRTEEEIQGTDWHGLVHPDDVEDYIADYLGAVRERRSWYNRNRIRRYDGEWCWFDNYGQPLFSPSGLYLGHVCVSTDITDTIGAEQRVQAERQKLYGLFMQAPAAIMVTRGREHVYELVNPLAIRIMGDHRPIIGRTVREVLPEAEEQGFLDLLDNVYQTGQPFIGNEVLGRFDNRGDGMLVPAYFNFVYQPSYDAAGKIDGVLCYVNDVTETVVARKRVEESEKRLWTLANSMPQLVWSANEYGEINFFNERICEYADISRDEQGIYGWRKLIHGDDLVDTERAWEQAKQTRSVFEHEQRVRMRDGTYRWHLARGVPVYENDTLVCWYGTKTDIEQLKQLDQQKNDFLGIVSHELKTPVTSAKAFAEVLESRFRAVGDERSAGLLGKLGAQMDKLAHLIGGLLDITRLDADKLSLWRDFFAFDELVDRVVEEVQHTARHVIQKEGRTGKMVYGDRERIGQVVANLLTNAIKYSPDASMVVVRSFASEQEVTLCVQDFGIGIARDKLPHVFERFFRENEGKEDTFAGLGLGLYVSAEIIQRHGGSIWVESEKGSGSTFYFRLLCQPHEGVLRLMGGEGEENA